jgi:protein-tyrosine phosphatase
MSSHTRILFVCLGNICRSPAAENIMRSLLQKHQISSVSLDSAGTADFHNGKETDPRMLTALEARGLTVTGRARKFEAFDFGRFDLIVAMDNENYEDVLTLTKSEEDEEKVRRFAKFCTEHEISEVPDPFHGEKEDFEEAIAIIEDGCRGLLKSLHRTDSR